MTSTRAGPTGFVHLHVRSEHSHLFGASRIDDLVRTAAGLGYHDLALTDRDGLYGAVEFYQAAREAGLRPIVGVELTSAPSKRGGSPHPPREPGAQRPAMSEANGRKPPANREEPCHQPEQSSWPRKRGHATHPSARPGRAVLLARSLDGYRTLCRLVTARHLNPDFRLAGALAGDHADVYVLVPDPRLLVDLAGRVPPGRLFALVEAFGDRFRSSPAGRSRSTPRAALPPIEHCGPSPCGRP